MIGSAPDFLRFLEAMRKGGAPVLEKSTAGAMFRNQIEGVSGVGPGFGFSFGGGLILDPVAMKTPESSGTLTWGGVYGHMWLVDPKKMITVIVFTNTAGGEASEFHDRLRDAVYEAIQ